MTSAMDLPLHGKVKLYETSKSELLNLWINVLKNNNISIRENSKVETIVNENQLFTVVLASGEQFSASTVLLSIGRRGSPRKLNIPGENLEKVAYRLLEPEDIKGKEILVVGGGDSAVESALLLCDQNKVVLSYRDEAFSRIKPKNSERIAKAITENRMDVKFKTNLVSVEKDSVVLSTNEEGKQLKLKNDLVYIFAGGELPIKFLEKVGLQITKKYGEAILKHK